MVATFYTAPCGGCGGAAWASYYGYQGTGSVNAGLKAGAQTYAASYIMSAQGTGANAPWYEQAVVQGVQNGLASRVQGGSFSDAFRQGAEYSIFQSGTDYLARESGLTAKDPDTGKLRTDGSRAKAASSPEDMSIFGQKYLGLAMGMEGDLHKYDSIGFMRAFIVDVSKVHDAMNSWMYNGDGYYVATGNVLLDSLRDVYSFAGMLPAAAFTARSPQYNPVIVGGHVN